MLFSPEEYGTAKATICRRLTVEQYEVDVKDTIGFYTPFVPFEQGQGLSQL